MIISSESEPRINHRNTSIKRGDVDVHVPQVRPHIRRRDLNLYFMISTRPLLELSREDVPLFDSIDGRRTLAELEKTCPGASDRLLRWHEAAIVELIPPIASPSAPHLVVIEPHMDDAALSTGGSLLHRRGRCRITILSVVKWSNFTSYLLLKRNYLDVSEISTLRQQESVLVARMLGAEHRCLNWNDAPLRFYPSERWSPATVEEFNKAPQDFAKGFPNPNEVSLLAEQLTQELTTLRPDELWIPMGLGDHLDHRTTRSACLRALVNARERFLNVPVLMYEDIPYSKEPSHAALIRTTLASCGTRLVRMTEDITDVFEAKLRLSSIYASQFKPSYLEPMLGGFARSGGESEGKLAEVFHSLEGERCLPLESGLSRDRASLAVLGAGLRSLLQKRIKCRRLRVMALPTGHLRDWKTDSEFLVSTFPNADLCVYAPANMAWQAQDGGNDKLRVELVYGGWTGWLKVIWHELFRFGTPTVVMWRGAYSATPPMRTLKKLINVFIKLLLPFRQVLFARRLCDFCCVLQEQAQQGLDATVEVVVEHSFGT